MVGELIEKVDAGETDWLGSMKMSFFIKGTPKPQTRPRFVNGHVISTPDKVTAAWKNRVRLMFVDAVKNFTGARNMSSVQPLAGALRIDMVFLMPIKDKKRHGEYCTSKPDKDNLEKLVLDALDNAKCLFAVDDSQVVAGDIIKIWADAEESGVMVSVTRPEVSKFGQKKTPGVTNSPGSAAFAWV